MTERANAVTLKGNPMTLLGPELKPGDAAPAFSLKAGDMSDKTLADYAGKVKLISVLTVSVDTPMAQKRWCGAAGVENVECLSDFKDHAFGPAYGVRIKEIGLLARQIIVVDKNDKVA